MNTKILKLLHLTETLLSAPRQTPFRNLAQLRQKIRPSPFLHRPSLVKESRNKITLVRSCQNLKCQLQQRLSHVPNLMFLLVLSSLKNIPEVLKSHSVKIVQNCVQNCENVMAHKIRRSQQILCLYSKLWDEGSLAKFISKLRARLKKHNPFMVFSGVSFYNWTQNRIPDEDILRYSAEMSLIEFLRRKRKACLKADNRPEECKCPVCTTTDSDALAVPSKMNLPGHSFFLGKPNCIVECYEDMLNAKEWQSFVEEDDIVVWKREDVNHKGEGLYCYKMYARYNDVTAYDFLEAQIDLDIRQSWDTHVVTMKLIDSEPETNSDIIYWETKWPALFSNRDYVFNRRYRIDKKRNLIYLVNRITEHPNCPPVKNKQRVSEYWSYMIIKPETTFDEPGIEFSLTYFDNPGIKVPSSITGWVTGTGMPEFLKKLRLAAHGVEKRRGGAPSPLASRNSACEAADDLSVTQSHFEEHSPSAVLLEALKTSFFLF